jgi:hypothetical protein
VPEKVPPDWSAVGQALDGRMKERGVYLPELAAVTELSRNTIQSLLDEASGIHAQKKHRRATLIALAEPLGWPPTYLVKVRDRAPRGELQREAARWSVMELAFRVQLLEADPQKIGDFLEAAASIQASVETLRRIAPEITGGGNSAV